MGVVAAFVASSFAFAIVGLLPTPIKAFRIVTLIAIASAFVIGYRLTTKHLPLVAWLLSAIALPAAFLTCARLFLADARDGWGGAPVTLYR